MKEKVEKVIAIPDGYISDYIDGKLRKDTPEEYVRQTIEKRLVNEHKFSKDRIKIEFGLKIGSSKRRCDIAIFPENVSNKTQNRINIIKLQSIIQITHHTLKQKIY